MDRRQVLATLGSLGVGGTAGCSTLVGRETLSNPRESQTAAGETALTFETGDTTVAIVSVDPSQHVYEASNGRELPLSVSIAQPTPTSLESLWVGIRTLPDGAQPPATVMLTTPFSNPHPALELYTDPDDGGAILHIPDLGDQGDGTVTFEFLLTSVEPSTRQLEFSTRIDASTPGVFGASYRLDALSLISMPGPVMEPN